MTAKESLIKARRIGGKDGLQRAKMAQQTVGDLIGVPAGQGVEEQQLQHLVVGKGIKPVAKKLFSFP